MQLVQLTIHTVTQMLSSKTHARLLCAAKFRFAYFHFVPLNINRRHAKGKDLVKLIILTASSTFLVKLAFSLYVKYLSVNIGWSLLQSGATPYPGHGTSTCIHLFFFNMNSAKVIAVEKPSNILVFTLKLLWRCRLLRMSRLRSRGLWIMFWNYPLLFLFPPNHTCKTGFESGNEFDKYKRFSPVSAALSKNTH